MRSLHVSRQLASKTWLKGLEDQSRTYQPPIDGQMTINLNHKQLKKMSEGN
jgi:hypothetical protein